MAGKKKVTWEQVKRRMKKLKIDGWFDGPSTPDGMMIFLDEFQRMRDGRKKAVQEFRERNKINRPKRKTSAKRSIRTLRQEFNLRPRRGES